MLDQNTKLLLLRRLWVFYCRSESQKASTVQEENSTMQRISTLVRTLGVVTLVGMTSFAPPLPAQAGGVHVSVGVGLPVVVAPAPVVVQPAPVVVVPQPVIVHRAPVFVTEPPVVVAEPRVVYGYPSYRGSYRHWKHR